MCIALHCTPLHSDLLVPHKFQMVLLEAEFRQPFLRRAQAIGVATTMLERKSKWQWKCKNIGKKWKEVRSGQAAFGCVLSWIEQSVVWLFLASSEWQSGLVSLKRQRLLQRRPVLVLQRSPATLLHKTK